MASYTPQRTVRLPDAADAFVRGMGDHVRTSGAFRPTGQVAYSYAEPIAAFGRSAGDRGVIYISTKKFSVTTSKHAGMIRRAAAWHGVTVRDASREEIHALV